MMARLRLALRDLAREADHDPRPFWRGVREDYRSTFAGIRQEYQQEREDWRGLIAEIRQDKQLTRRMNQRVTGEDNPTRREIRAVWRAVGAEMKELEKIERRVVADHNQGDGH